MTELQTAAITELKTATTVAEWNTIRTKHLKILGTESAEQREFIHFYIDGTGLIIKTLGKDTFTKHNARKIYASRDTGDDALASTSQRDEKTQEEGNG